MHSRKLWRLELQQQLLNDRLSYALACLLSADNGTFRRGSSGSAVTRRVDRLDQALTFLCQRVELLRIEGSRKAFNAPEYVRDVLQSPSRFAFGKRLLTSLGLYGGMRYLPLPMEFHGELHVAWIVLYVMNLAKTATRLMDQIYRAVWKWRQAKAGVGSSQILMVQCV